MLQEEWTIKSDEDLLNALQTISSDIMANIQRLDQGIISLEQRTASLNARYQNAAFDFKMLGETQFIEQVHRC